MKRIISFVLILLSFIESFSQTFEIDGLFYDIISVSDKTVSFAGWDTDVTTINIPEKVQFEGQDYIVTSIICKRHVGNYLQEVTIPPSVTIIGAGSFSRCTNLESINIPNGVTTIETRAFYYCTALKSITIPPSVTSIESNAFSRCTRLSDISFSDDLTFIGENAFEGTFWFDRQPNGLICIGKVAYKYKGSMPTNTSIIIPDGFTSISSNAFYDCRGLSSITIPETVNSVGNSAFCGCELLESVTIPSGVTTIEAYVFDGCKSLKTISIPHTIKSIGHSAFGGCRELKSITIPESVTSIGNDAFSGCILLDTIIIPFGVTSIGSYVFDGCRSLKSITLPESVTSIGDHAFSQCTELTTITLPENIDSIGESAFSLCNNLEFINFSSNSVKYIGNNAFSNTLWYDQQPNGLVRVGSVIYKYKGTNSNDTSITIPDGITSIGASAFSGSYTLKSIIIPESVTNIGDFAFSGCELLDSLIIPSGVTSIGSYVFNSCKSLKSITLPESVTSIGDYAFSQCILLSYISLPKNVTIIGDYAFFNCTELTSIDIPSSITSIGKQAFYNCSKLLTVTIHNNISLIYTDSNGYKSIINPFDRKDLILIVPSHLQEEIKEHTIWGSFLVILPIGTPLEREILLSKTGYSTFYDSKYVYEIPPELDAFVVTDISNGTLIYDTIAHGAKNEFIPNGTPVILKSKNLNSNTCKITLTAKKLRYDGSNYLLGSDNELNTYSDHIAYYYKLSYGPSETDLSRVFGWYWGAEDGGAFKIDAHKAWLAIPIEKQTKGAVGFNILGEPIEPNQQQYYPHENKTVVYDLYGRVLSSPDSEQQIIIQNGKKYLDNK